MRQVRRACQKGVAVIVAGILFVTAQGYQTARGLEKITEREPVQYEQLISYMEYREENSEVATIEAGYRKEELPEAYSAGKEIQLAEYQGKAGVMITGESGYVDFPIEVDKTGLYAIEITYCAIEGKGVAIERKLSIDGKTPFSEAGNISFDRLWKDETNVRETHDVQDNEIQPKQKEVYEWRTSSLRDGSGYYSEPLLFCFSQGKHQLRLESVREPMAISRIALVGYSEPKSYQEYKEQYESESRNGTAMTVKLEAEEPHLKSDPMLVPSFDRSSPLSSPQSTGEICLNTISGERFKTPGQWIEWQFSVPEDGLYQIGMRARQNAESGFIANRKLLIDGEVPFQEAAEINFQYSTEWRNVICSSGDERCLFYLKKGQHTIRLEATVGKMRTALEQTDDVMEKLNTAYRKLLMILGATPDIYRDYDLENEVPEIFEMFQETGEQLEQVLEEISSQLEERGQSTSIFNTLIEQLKDFNDQPDSIAKRFSAFKSNISSLGTWLLTAREQPVQIDYIIVAEPEYQFSKAESGFWSKAVHEIKMFLSSFFEDYSSISSASGSNKVLTVWTTMARDQTNILGQMLRSAGFETFSVNLQMVGSGTLLPSVLAGKGPDVALSQASGDVMNYAARNALEALNGYEGFEEIEKQFMDSAKIPLEYNGQSYALPETQVFPVMFYRKDILSELKLPIPETWEDIYEMIPELQKQNMTIGLPTGLPSFAMLLFQSGGSFYNSDGTKSALDTETSVRAFRTQTELFQNYSLLLSYDFSNRFRSGEMPIAIAEYTAYNQLAVFAPEIKGMWSFALLPGTRNANGSINRKSTSTTTGAVMLKGSNNKDAAWEFLRWWVGAETQIQFGRELESLLGVAARYYSANVEALKASRWLAEESEVLGEQWKQAEGIPEMPGGYYTSRYLDFAFKKVVVNGESPRETLLDYVDTINNEITYKRLEFGLPVSDHNE